MNSLAIYTIYARPVDSPQLYVVRRFAVASGDPLPVSDRVPFMVSGDLSQVRQILVRMGLHCIPRSTADDSEILESWV